MDKKFLGELCEIDSIATYEGSVRKKLKEKHINADSVEYDGIGSQIFNYKGKGPKVMFAAHMDEVGFMVRNITDIGMLDVIPIGGVKDSAKQFQKVTVTTEEGKKIKGLMNSKMDGEKAVSTYVDLGLENAEQVKNLGIEIGNMVTFSSKSEWLSEDILMAKALDDRIGNFVLAEVAQRLSEVEHECDLYLCNTVQEEVGTRGGKCSADIINPDIFFAVDVACAPNLERGSSNHRKMGKGFMILHYDKTMIPNRKLLKYLKSIVNKHNIEFQSDMFGGGGTDAGNAHMINGGRPAAVLGIPLRYCHGSYSMVSMTDVELLVEFIIEIIKDIDNETIKEITDFE